MTERGRHNDGRTAGQEHAVAEESTKFQVIDRAVAIIDAVREHSPASLAAVARASGLSEATALRYVTALRQHRVIRRDPVGSTYSLGMRLFEWGEAASGAYDPKRIAGPMLERIVDEFGETVELAGLETRNRLIVLDARPGRHGISKVVQIGDNEQWHATAVGKALLAAMSIDKARDIIRGSRLHAFTDRTCTSVAELERELAACHERGYAIDDEESELGLRCVGVAARDLNGEPAFSMSVSGPSYRMTDERIGEVARTLTAAAMEMERAWGLTSPGDSPGRGKHGTEE